MAKFERPKARIEAYQQLEMALDMMIESMEILSLYR